MCRSLAAGRSSHSSSQSAYWASGCPLAMDIRVEGWDHEGIVNNSKCHRRQRDKRWGDKRPVGRVSAKGNQCNPGGREPKRRGRRRSQAESRPQLRFRTMLRAGDSDPNPTLGGPGPLPGPSPLTRSPDCRRTSLPPLLVLWAGPARGKGRGWLPPCAREAGRRHSWATSGPSAEGPNGTEGRLSSRAGRGRLSFFSPRGAWRISGDQSPNIWPGLEEVGLGLGVEFDTGAFSLSPRVPPACGSGG